MKYNLLLNTDSGYVKYLYVLVKSIFDTLDVTDENRDDELVFHILVDSSVHIKSTKQNLEELAADSGSKIQCSFNLYLVDERKFANATPMQTDLRLNDSVRHAESNSLSNYYRLLCASYVSQDIDLLLYLDIDTRLFKDIRGIFADYDVSNYLLAALTDHCLPINDFVIRRSDNTVTKIPRATYFNSGVMLINLKVWREMDIEGKALELTHNYILKYHDQTALNYICNFHQFPDGIKPFLDMSIGDNFNLGYLALEFDYDKSKLYIRLLNDNTIEYLDFGPSDIYRFYHDVRLLHYTNIKPWCKNGGGNFTFYDLLEDSINKWRRYAATVRLAHLDLPPFKLSKNEDYVVRDYVVRRDRKLRKQLLLTILGTIIITWVMMFTLLYMK